MSKGNMLLGHARGKVGSLVFSRANGKQITRAAAEVVKNPQTTAQMIQRIIMQTCVQAYSKMSAIIDHSFEGVKVGQDSMSYFLRNAVGNLRTTLAEVGDLDAGEPVFCPLGVSGLAVNEYPLSKGTLPKIIAQNVASGGFELQLSGNTYGDFIDTFGLQRGDQLTFCIVAGSNLYNTNFKYARVILDPLDVDGNPAPLESALFAGNNIAYGNARNENYGLAFQFNPETGLMIVTTADSTEVAAAAVIVSRKGDNDAWKRSDSQLIVADGASVGISMQAALDAFREGGLEVINPRYLNNASGRAAAAQQASPAPVDPTAPQPITIMITGEGQASVKNGETAIVSGATVVPGTTLTIHATPVQGKTPTAKLNGNDVALSQSGSEYVGTFAMPAGATTVAIDTKTAGGDWD